MQQPVSTSNPGYLHLNVNRVLNNFTKYVSKPLGFDKLYSETKTKHGTKIETFDNSIFYGILLSLIKKSNTHPV